MNAAGDFAGFAISAATNRPGPIDVNLITWAQEAGNTRGDVYAKCEGEGEDSCAPIRVAYLVATADDANNRNAIAVSSRPICRRAASRKAQGA